jgi:hypothetical protein
MAMEAREPCAGICLEEHDDCQKQSDARRRRARAPGRRASGNSHALAAPVPASVQVGSVARGRTADAPVVITSIGAASLRVGAVRIEGADRADFSVSRSTCAKALLPKDASCTITVRFKPSAVGARSAQLVVEDNAIESPLRIDLAGTGT